MGGPASFACLAERRVSAASWWLVTVLFLLNILAMVDRLILTMLVGPIKADLALSDFEMSLILGPAFALLYAIVGIPLGWAADRWPRRRVLLCGIALWSAATMLSGAARSFWSLFAGRAFVGAGEASLYPAAISMIADEFPPDRVTTAISVFQSSAKIGSAVAFGVGGLAIAAAHGLGNVTVPIVGTLRSWQLVMAVVGASGFVFALLLLTVTEPVRRDHPAPAVDQVVRREPTRLVAFVRTDWQLWTAMLLGFSAMAVVAYSLVLWGPTYIERHFGWPPQRYGPALSVTNLAAAASLIANGWIVDRLYRRGIRDIHLRFYRWLIALFSPAIVLLFFVENPYLFIILFGLVQFVTVPFVIYVGAVIAMLAPNAVRGQLTALYIAAFATIGQGLGAPLVGGLTDFIFGDERAIGKSLAIVVIGCSAITFLFLGWALRHLRAAVDRGGLTGSGQPLMSS